jgi:Protein of unknown function (DUF2878)
VNSSVAAAPGSTHVPSLTAVIVNFVLFQLAWFACVITAARGSSWLGVLAVLLVAAVHVVHSPRPKAALRLLLIVTGLGVVWDSSVLFTGWIRYVDGWSLVWLAPAWIIAMWTLFGTLLNVSLRWLRGRWLLAAGFGLIGGPLAYYGGVKLGAVTLMQPFNVLLLQGIGWAMLTPLLVHLARRYDV